MQSPESAGRWCKLHQLKLARRADQQVPFQHLEALLVELARTIFDQRALGQMTLQDEVEHINSQVRFP
jgi:hypothetical protein